MLCKKCGKEYPEGANVCPSCNISLEQCDKEKQGGFPVGIGKKGFLTTVAAAANAVGKVNKDSATVRAVGVAPAVVGAIAYGIPAPNTGSAVGTAVATAGALGVRAIPCPEGAARTLYGMPPISSRIFEDRDYERVKDTKLCNHCNAKIKLDDKVCPQCGKKLGFAALCEVEDEYKKS